MSVAALEQRTYRNTQDNKQNILAERTRILETVARKSQEKTLTLKETTDLYAKFNLTYEASNNALVVDESWALELLQESEEEDIRSSYELSMIETRVNGVKQKLKKQDVIKVEEELIPASSIALPPNNSTKILFQQQRFEATQAFYEPSPPKSSHRFFVSLMAVSALSTLSALIGFSWFI
jgi:hypothetical protein